MSQLRIILTKQFFIFLSALLAVSSTLALTAQEEEVLNQAATEAKKAAARAAEARKGTARTTDAPNLTRSPSQKSKNVSIPTSNTALVKNEQGLDDCLLALNKANKGTPRAFTAQKPYRFKLNQHPYSWDGTRVLSEKTYSLIWSKNLSSLANSASDSKSLEIRQKIVQAEFESACSIPVSKDTNTEFVEKLKDGFESCQGINLSTSNGKSIAEISKSELNRLKKIFPIRQAATRAGPKAAR